MFLLAWRNVWRNRRRTAITVLSIGSGLAALLFGQSLVRTIQYQLVEKATGVFTGHIQVHHQDTTDLKFPDHYISEPEAVEAAIRGAGNVQAYQRRLTVTGMVSTKKESAGILICGVEPLRDKEVLTMHSYLSRGRNLSGAANEMFLGYKLAKKLGIDLGGEVVLMATAVDGSLGAELMKVVGIFDSGSQTFDDSIVYVPLEAAQAVLAVDGGVNNFVLKLKDPSRIRETQAKIAASLKDRPLKVVTWEDVDPELVGIRDYQNALLTVVLFVVFAIVALGILNTLLMAMFERVREFGVLMAIGARPSVIQRLIILESCIMGGLGASTGMGIGCLMIIYYWNTGLNLPVGDAIGFFMPFDSVLYLRFNWPSHMVALAAVFVTSVLSGIPPARRVVRMSPAESLRHI